MSSPHQDEVSVGGAAPHVIPWPDRGVDCPACKGEQRIDPCRYCNGRGEVHHDRLDVIRLQADCNGTRIGEVSA